MIILLQTSIGIFFYVQSLLLKVEVETIINNTKNMNKNKSSDKVNCLSSIQKINIIVKCKSKETLNNFPYA